MADEAMSLRLKEAFMAHLEETEGHASVIAPSLFTALADWATPRDVTAPFRVEG